MAGKSVVPIVVVLLVLLVAWYLGSIALNAPVLLDNYARSTPSPEHDGW